MLANPAASASPETPWALPDRGVVGLICLIVAETALFSIFLIAYIFYIGRSLNPPYPKDVLTLPIWATVCLLSSSITIVIAEHALHRNRIPRFRIFWGITLLLGAEFLRQTGLEWHHFIYKDHLTISTNLFGTTYYTLVGLHASHVIVGVALLLLVFIASLTRFPVATQFRRIRFLSWYWHFVDAVWVVVFSVVYVIGRQ